MAAVSSVSSRPIQSVPIKLVDPAQPRRIKLRLRGMSPLLLDPMSPEVTEAMITGKKLQIAKDRPLEQVCAEKLDILRRANRNRQIVLPRKYLWGALLNAGEHVPYKGRMNISTASSPGKSRKSRLPAFFRIEDRNFVLFDDDGGEPAWETDINVGNGATSKNGVCRPVFECWNFDLTIQYDDGDVNEKTIKQLFSVAGKMIGLGCMRAGVGGENGQFMVDSWEDITPADWPRAKKAKAKLEPSDSGEPENGNGEEKAENE